MEENKSSITSKTPKPGLNSSQEKLEETYEHCRSTRPDGPMRLVKRDLPNSDMQYNSQADYQYIKHPFSNNRQNMLHSPMFSTGQFSAESDSPLPRGNLDPVDYQEKGEPINRNEEAMDGIDGSPLTSHSQSNVSHEGDDTFSQIEDMRLEDSMNLGSSAGDESFNMDDSVSLDDNEMKLLMILKEKIGVSTDDPLAILKYSSKAIANLMCEAAENGILPMQNPFL